MSYEDRISIDTPEGVRLEMPVAGLGSRISAAVVDVLIQTLLLAVVAFVAFVAGGETVGAVLLVVGATAVFLGYDILFEVRRSGRTPGKKAAGIRVVDKGGHPVTFRASAVRNILRLVDMLPGVYAVGIISVLVTRNHQRLGDLAAGTIVVRERRGTVATSPIMPLRPHLAEELDMWDTAAVSVEDLATVRRFLERRGSLRADARSRLARELAARLRRVVVAPSGHYDDEVFLEQLVAAKRGRAGGI